MSNRNLPPVPPWNPDALGDLAKAAGITLEQLRREIREAAGRDRAEIHLSFEELASDEFTEDRRLHLESCEFCQELRETIHPSPEMLERFRRGLEALEQAGSFVPMPAVARRSSTKQRDMKRSTGDWSLIWPSLAVAASIAFLLLGIAIAPYLDVERKGIVTVAQLFNEAGEFASSGDNDQAAGILVTALSQGGANTSAIWGVRYALPSNTGGAEWQLEKVREHLIRIGYDETQQPVLILTVAQHQFQSGQWAEGYQTLGEYLKVVDPKAPTTSAYQQNFVASLPAGN